MQAGTRPRYGRIGATSAALAITLVTLLGGLGLGLLPDGSSATAASDGTGSGGAATLSGVALPEAVRSVSPEPRRTPTPSKSPTGTGTGRAAPATTLPAATGTGKRVVFDIGDQRMWLVDPDAGAGTTDGVLSTYLVSGSLTNNLGPGTYEVYSTSRWAVGIDDSGTMEYFVRFTRGANAAIGFHSIPAKDGRLLQTRAQLGTPQSHGCIRQALPDAKRLWDFAPVGTKVVVTR